jgi:hypothetical protein
MNKLLQFLCIALLATSITVFAATASPEKVAAEYFRTNQNEGLAATAPFMHTDALVSFKKKLAPIFESEAKQANPRITQAILGPGATFATYTNASPFKVMQSFMNLAEAVSQTVDLKYTRFELLGTVTEGDVRHVLARVSLASTNGSNTRMQVISLKLDRDEWKVLVTSELNGMAEGFISAAAKEQKGAH